MAIGVLLAIVHKQYGIQAVADGVILLQKGVGSQPELLEAWKRLRQDTQTESI
jgi:hypothetical protein